AQEVWAIPAFRRLWIGLGLSSLGDWLGLLALTAMASSLAGATYQSQNFAIAGVLFVRVVPALVLGPLAGYIADRLDRRRTLVIGDIARGLIFASIPVVHTLQWVLIATALIEAISLVWLPAKDATVPNLVPRDRLVAANQIMLSTTYGSALPAAVLFILLSLTTKALHSSFDWLDDPAALALWFNAGSFVVSGLVIATMREIPAGPALVTGQRLGIFQVIFDGWAYVARTPLIRALVVGITGAFAAGGVVIGLGRVFVADLGGGDPGYGLLFGSVFGGLALGMWLAPRLFTNLSRPRLFAVALILAGVVLAAIAVVANLVVVTMLSVGLGFCAGAAWITGYTLLGLEVEDALRGRTFAFVQTLIRLALALVLALAPLLAGVIGRHRLRVNDEAVLDYNGAAITIFLSALVMIAVGVLAYRSMNDEPGTSMPSSSRRSKMSEAAVYTDRGLFIAFEGGEGAGKSTQARSLERWLKELGFDVMLTHQPGDSLVGQKLRQILLDPQTGALDARTETLLYAADKAEHVARRVRPALARGAVVITDRYVDSTLAYQGAGRALATSEIERVARWATGDLRPHLTVLLDVDPRVGLDRFDKRDRLEAEPLAFHERVRESFLALAESDRAHYLVLDARLDRDEISRGVRTRVEPLLSLAERHVRADAR
ncbi:MAG: dTMP kinase, partial [Nocardioidaceae bacterium]|nr:dTMP kinase [Nocardioidaceae bacterium]